MTKNLIKSVLAISFLFIFISPVYAEKVTFIKEYMYQASELDSKHSSRTISLELVKRLLLEELKRKCGQIYFSFNANARFELKMRKRWLDKTEYTLLGM
ncbi:MAG: hypothetical protein AABY52_06320 [Deltaproteobacteria bacterium]